MKCHPTGEGTLLPDAKTVKSKNCRPRTTPSKPANGHTPVPSIARILSPGERARTPAEESAVAFAIERLRNYALILGEVDGARFLHGLLRLDPQGEEARPLHDAVLLLEQGEHATPTKVPQEEEMAFITLT